MFFESGLGLGLKVLHGSADLLVGGAGDVLHEEVDEPALALQDGEDADWLAGRLRFRTNDGAR